MSLCGFRLALIASAVLCALCTLTATANAESSPSPFLVMISEGVTDLSTHGGGTHDCMLVRTNGQVHLESRKQQLPRPGADLEVSKLTLDSLELERLRTILMDEKIWALPPEVQPAVPMDVPWVHGFNAQIARGNEVRRVGYWIWKGGSPDGSPNSAAEDVKKGWRQAEIALRPLVDWFHEVEASHPKEADGQSTMCEPESQH